MDLETFRALLTSPGQEAIHAAEQLAPREVDFLAHFQALSRDYPADLARGALEIAILRREAVVKFPEGGRMYLTRAALEQASPFEVSTYRAARFRDCARLADLGCSVGGDTFSLAAVAPTLGIELDPLRLTMARANASALGWEGRTRFVQADLNTSLPLRGDGNLGLFFDPARRRAGRRVHSVRDYLPPLNRVDEWLEHFPATGVKISPGVKLAELQPFDAEIEFISLRSELKEAALWFGPLKTAGRRATILPGPHTLAWNAPGGRTPGQPPSAGSPSDIPSGLPDLPLREPQSILYEPDPAVLRAGLVALLGAQLQAAQLDPDIAYLTSEKHTPTPFARAWAVEDWFPFQLKRLRAYLRERGVGRVTVKKRGSPLQPEALIRDLRLSGEQERVIFLTHLRGRPIVVTGRELEK